MIMIGGTPACVHLDKKDFGHSILYQFQFGIHMGGVEFIIQDLFYSFFKEHTSIVCLRLNILYHGILPYNVENHLQNFTIGLALADLKEYTEKAKSQMNEFRGHGHTWLQL